MNEDRTASHPNGRRSSLLVLAKAGDWAAIQQTIEDHSDDPELLREWASASSSPSRHPRHDDEEAAGRTALHESCIGGAPPVVVRALLSAYPEAARATDSDGSMPLHLCLQRRPRGLGTEQKQEELEREQADIVRMLLGIHPEAAAHKTAVSGNTPLHTAVIHGASVESVEALLSVGPGADSASTLNRLGLKTPLETAMDVRASPAVIGAICRCGARHALVRANPHGLQVARRGVIEASRAIEDACRSALLALLRKARDEESGGDDCWLLRALERRFPGDHLLPLVLEGGSSPAVHWDRCYRSVAVLDALRPLLPPSVVRVGEEVPIHIAACRHEGLMSAVLCWHGTEAAIGAVLGRRAGSSEDWGQDEGSAAATSAAAATTTTPLLCAALRIPELPAGYLRLLLRIVPDQATGRADGRTGELPLHAALERLGTRGNFAFERESCLTLVRDVLACHPGAASVRDRRGAFPLHALIANGVGWDAGVGQMVAACPWGILAEVGCAGNSLFPNILARVASGTAGCGISTMFELIREAPNLLSLERNRNKSKASDKLKLA